MAQNREGRIEKEDIQSIADQSRLGVDDVYRVLWAVADAGYDCVRRYGKATTNG